MKNSTLVIILIIFYLIILGTKKRKSSKCILEPMNNPKFDNFVEKQFEPILDPLKEIKFSPKCCPSTYSTDRGCACMTPESLELIRGRASNRDGCLGGYV
jgi:hypothetical protein